MKLTVYADVLMLTNLYINFLLLRITSRLTSVKLGFWRTMLGAAVGSVFSLYILLPEIHFLLTAAVRAVMAAVIVFASFGRRRLKVFLRLFAAMFLSAFGFAGAMFGVWTAFKPRGMLINNSVVYFNISPLILIVTSAACYLITLAITALTRRTLAPPPPTCKVNIDYGVRSVTTDALIDTGNELRDSFTDTPVIVVDERVADTLLPCQVAHSMATMGAPPEQPVRGYRLIPYSVVGSNGLMPVFRPDRVRVTYDNNEREVSALIGISSNRLDGSFGAIVGHSILDE